MEANNPFAALSEYEVRNLTAHLEEAGRGQELHHLLQLEVVPAKEEPPVRSGLQGRFARLFGRDQPGPRLPGRNAWYSLKDELGDLDGYLSDVARGWRLAAQESARGVAHGEQAASIGLEVRYALVRSSLSSVAGNILPSFVAALVTHEVWSLPEAVAYTRSIPDLWQRVQTLALLVPSAPEPLKAEIVSEGLNLLLGPNPPGDDREERDREAESDFGPLEAFVAWTPYLPEAMLPQALAVARNLRGSVTSVAAAERVQALAALAAHLVADAREAVFREALEQARADSTAAALKAIAPLAPAAVFPEILDMARTIEHPSPRLEALAALIAYAPLDRQADLIREALTVAQAFDDVERRVEALTSLAPYVPESVCRETVELARTLTLENWDGTRVEALAKLVPFLSEPFQTQVRAQALAEARAIAANSGMVEALAMVIPLLPEQEQVMVLREALTTVQRATYGAGVKGIILWPLAPLLPKPFLNEWLRGLLLHCDEVNHWGSGTPLMHICRMNEQTAKSNSTLIVPSGLELSALADALAVPHESIVATTYQAELARIYGVADPHALLLSTSFAFRLCPACVAQDCLLTRTLVLPHSTICPQHQILLVNRCLCGTAFRPFHWRTLPFRCLKCGLDWAELPRNKVDQRRIEIEGQLLSYYQFFWTYGTSEVLESTPRLVYDSVVAKGTIRAPLSDTVSQSASLGRSYRRTSSLG